MGLSVHEKQIEDLLREHHAELVQEHPHRKYRFPDGRKFVMAFTPSDHRAVKNALRSLRNFLGLKRPEPAPRERELDRKIRQEVQRVTDQRPLLGAARRSLFEELLEKVPRP